MLPTKVALTWWFKINMILQDTLIWNAIFAGFFYIQESKKTNFRNGNSISYHTLLSWTLYCAGTNRTFLEIQCFDDHFSVHTTMRDIVSLCTKTKDVYTPQDDDLHKVLWQRRRTDCINRPNDLFPNGVCSLFSFFFSLQYSTSLRMIEHLHAWLPGVASHCRT